MRREISTGGSIVGPLQVFDGNFTLITTVSYLRDSYAHNESTKTTGSNSGFIKVTLSSNNSCRDFFNNH